METGELSNSHLPRDFACSKVVATSLLPQAGASAAMNVNSWLPSKMQDYYTGGWCWSLAWHLSRFGGWPIVTVGTEPPPAPWQHVCVRVGDRYLDAEGLHSKVALRRKWGRYFNELGTFKDRRTYLRHVFKPYQYGTVADWDYNANRTAKIARRIVDRLTSVD
jgi:hypothetical protein